MVLKIGSLCTGYGGLDTAVQAVWPDSELAWWSDIEQGPIAVASRHYPGVPNIGDLTKLDWYSLDPVDILTAGYPCQPFSNAGKRLGTKDPRHIWPDIAKGIGVLRPGIVVLENVAAHLRRGFDVVSADLASMGYGVRWGVVRASDAGAPHQRRRLFIVAEDAAHSNDLGCSRCRSTRARRFGSPNDGATPSNPHGTRLEGSGSVGSEAGGERRPVYPYQEAVDWGRFEPAIRRWERITGRLAPNPTETGRSGATILSPRFVEWMMELPEGLVTDTPKLSRARQLKLLGNGVVPQQAELALRLLLGGGYAKEV